MRRRLIAGPSGGDPPEYLGSATATYSSPEGQWSNAGQGPDILDHAGVGDLVVMCVTASNHPAGAWSFAGMPMTEISAGNMAAVGGEWRYAGYRIVQSGDTNPYVTGLNNFKMGSAAVVVSAYRNATTLLDFASSTATGATMPNPPSLTENGKLWLATGHMLNGSYSGAPTDYDLAGSIGSGSNSQTAIAHRIFDTASQDPSTFSGTGGFRWGSLTIAFE